jgi:hypothetical protein
MKKFNEQPEFNANIKNEDSLYKFLAYSGVLEKKRKQAPGSKLGPGSSTR